MENLDRKDNRLLSSLTDLKLENMKCEVHNEDVWLVLSFRVRERRAKWEYWEPSMITKSIKISYKSSKRRQLMTKHWFLRA